jgi:hypothetical protein
MSWCVEQVAVVPEGLATPTAKEPLVLVAQVEWCYKVFTWIPTER